MVLRVCAVICGAAILLVYSSSAMAKPGNVHSGSSSAAGRHDGVRRDANAASARASIGSSIVGTASMYTIPFSPDMMKAA